MEGEEFEKEKDRGCVCDNSCDLRSQGISFARSAEFMSLKKTMLKDIEKGVKTHDFKSTETMSKKTPHFTFSQFRGRFKVLSFSVCMYVCCLFTFVWSKKMSEPFLLLQSFSTLLHPLSFPSPSFFTTTLSTVRSISIQQASQVSNNVKSLSTDLGCV